ncbi:MAG: preprotein translocase subunit SecG [Candidatus Omnitrophica bacterium]|nr:preprotein translocase subunit SecG [Candidatus Omnitrophota bacterium]MDE2008755.1 preprotein translocase subunit SecG [Candidatus Omnitrophota bacterium]MDE2215308.1 preprotein translocase subunit SecG [Candidatus Omnitrophota bacterium]MDE2232147.1 preprotein translocase subunit SecG [Candidatus Omnitrophota bacterium]
MITFVLVIHVLTCIFLVVAILMQAGRGGGLTETFQSAESMFGTQTNSLMVRVTTVLAVVFLSTSLFLAFTSSRGNGSLMSNKKLLSTVPDTPAATENAPHVKVGTPRPLTNAEE